MADLKYFNTSKKGEIFELKAELNSEKKEKKKEAVKKIIASMTVGKDVSSLFPDVINCMQTDNLELKKLVYLYLMNYAKTQPDLAILAVNTFVKDCEDPNPLIRALAVRTMGCIRVDKIAEYLCDPLRQCLKDEDPYVRKTAAVCVAKLHDINPQLVEEQGFLILLKQLISDSNPMVISNAVAALSEIASSSNTRPFDLDTVITNKLLTALNECSEWGQVFLLDAIATYTPRDEREAQSICERVTSRLAHANSAVVLSAVKVLMLLLDKMDSSSEFYINLEKKLAPPLVTLLSAEPEIQFVALRNISIIIQKRPSILTNELRVFFVKYNDPIYVKLEKLNIMIRLTNNSNINQVISELKEYATEVDVEFVCKAVRAIGRCAIKVEESAERCVSTLLDLVKTKVNYVVQESVIVIKDIFRKYPNRYEGIISTLCENLDTLDEPEARASMIWIIGQYAERIENATDILSNFLDGFAEETNPQVQLQLLTAIVKTFLKKPKESQHLITKVLQLAAEESDNPDVRDRGYIYWRLLSTDSQAARDIVLADKPNIGEETDNLEPALLDELISYIGTLVSVFQRPPKSFLDRNNIPHRTTQLVDNVPFSNAGKQIEDYKFSKNEMIESITNSGFNTPNLLDIDSFQETPNKHTNNNINLIFDAELESILGVSSPVPPTLETKDQAVSGLDDILDLLSINKTTVSTQKLEIQDKKEWLNELNGKGLCVSGNFSLDSERNIVMQMTFSNKLDWDPSNIMTNFAMQLNRNPFRLCLSTPLQINSLQPNSSDDFEVTLSRSGNLNTNPCPLLQLQVAVKNNFGVFYFAVDLPLIVVLNNNGSIQGSEYISVWKGFPDDIEKTFTIECDNVPTADNIIERLKAHNIFTVSRQNIDGNELVYQSIKLSTANENMFALIELRILPNVAPTISIRCSNTDITDAIHDAYQYVIRKER